MKKSKVNRIKQDYKNGDIFIGTGIAFLVFGFLMVLASIPFLFIHTVDAHDIAIDGMKAGIIVMFVPFMLCSISYAISCILTKEKPDEIHRNNT